MIPFNSNPGGLFNRLGKLALLMAEMRDYQDTQFNYTINTTNGVVAQFDSESDIQAVMGNSYQSILSGPEGAGSVAAQMALATINRMVYRDNPLPNQTLNSQNTLGSIYEIIEQMITAGETIRKVNVTSSNGSFIGTGNGVIVSSVVRPSDGRMLENCFSENIRVTCIADSYTGGVSVGSESFAITGVGTQNDLFAFNWPLGSNCNIQVSAINGDLSGSGGNILTNSGFSSWSGNTPSNFSIDVGTAGVNVFQETSIVYSTGSSMRILGDGVTLIEITQQLGSSTGSFISLSPQTIYAVNLFMRTGAVAPGAGVLTIDLVDGDNIVLLDEANTPNSFTIDLTTLDTNWESFTGTFRTPIIMPSELYFRLRLTTPLTPAISIYLDKMSLGLMFQTYPSGPYFSVHSGSVPFVIQDYGLSTITNNRGAGGTLNTFQTALARMLNPYILQNGILFPSSSTPTIDDSLIG